MSPVSSNENCCLDRASFEELFSRSIERCVGFASGFVREQLPRDVQFQLLPNGSFDVEPRYDDQAVFPEEDLPFRHYHEMTFDQAAKFLWREGMLPEWIELHVSEVKSAKTVVEVRVCGRFTKNEQRFYCGSVGTGPFRIKSPALPSWNHSQSGERFFLFNPRRRGIYHRRDLDCAEMQAFSNRNSRDRLFEFFGEIVDRCDSRLFAEQYFSDMTQIDRILFSAASYVTDVGNGGLPQFLYNGTGAIAVDTVENFFTIGAFKSAYVLRAAIALFPNRKPEFDDTKRQAQMAEFDDEARDRLHALNELLFDTNEDVAALAVSYASQQIE